MGRRLIGFDRKVMRKVRKMVLPLNLMAPAACCKCFVTLKDGGYMVRNMYYCKEHVSEAV